jgi:hypothetical protein
VDDERFAGGFWREGKSRGGKMRTGKEGFEFLVHGGVGDEGGGESRG